MLRPRIIQPEEAAPEFRFAGRRLRYNRIPFNNRAERCVEIPIAFDFLARRRGRGRLCEVGHVLAQYDNFLGDGRMLRPRRIIDRYEQDRGVDNVDLLQIDDAAAYDTIVAISTVEHIGQPWGRHPEARRDVEGPLQGVAKIYDLLRPGGRALITVPFGELSVGMHQIQFSWPYLRLLWTRYGIPRRSVRVRFLAKVGAERLGNNPRQIWREARQHEVANARYHAPFDCSQALAIVELERTGPRRRDRLAAFPDLTFATPMCIGSAFSSAVERWAPVDERGRFHVGRDGAVISARFTRPIPEWFQFLIQTRSRPALRLAVRGRSWGAAASSRLLFESPLTAAATDGRFAVPPGTVEIALEVVNRGRRSGEVWFKTFEIGFGHGP